MEEERELIRVLLADIEAKLVPTVAQRLQPDDFGQGDCRAVYEQIILLANEKGRVSFFDLGGRVAKSILRDVATEPAQYYSKESLNVLIEKIKESAKKRKIHELLRGSIQQLEKAGPEFTIANIYDKAANIINEEEEVDHGVGAIAQSVITSAPEVVFSSGLPTLDKIIGGITIPHIIIVGGYTGRGKTHFLLEVALQTAFSGAKNIFFSTEMTKEELVLRLIGKIANISPFMVRRTKDPVEQGRINLAIEKLNSIGDRLFIYDNQNTIEDISWVTREYKNKHSIDFVFIDFIQNIMAGNAIDDYQRMTLVSIQLQQLKVDTKVGMVISSQVSNEAAGGGRRDGPIQYKGSGAIAQIADAGLWIEKPPESDEFTDQRVLRVVKSRHALGGTVNFRLLWPSGRVVEPHNDTINPYERREL